MRKERILLLIVCFGLLSAIGFGANASAQAQSDDGVVFKTPEDAITLYMQGIAESDIDKILQACAIDEMSENFNLNLSTARIEVLDPYRTQACKTPAPDSRPVSGRAYRRRRPRSRPSLRAPGRLQDGGRSGPRLRRTRARTDG